MLTKVEVTITEVYEVNVNTSASDSDEYLKEKAYDLVEDQRGELIDRAVKEKIVGRSR